MQAIAYTRYGGPEVTQIINVPVPTPAATEVQIKVSSVGLNPIDWHQRQGELATVYPQQLPVIGGNELSGVVTAIGESVTGFAAGDSVICRTTKSTWGAMAKYVVFPQSIVAKAPTTVSIIEAAGVPLAGLTADQALDRLDAKAGDRLLITGGAGGVGQFAIQLAKLRGCHVTTTASKAGMDAVLQAGADKVVDYRSQKLAELPDKFDKVFDTVGGQDALALDVIPATKRGGKIVSVGGPQTPGCLDEILPWWKRPIVNAVLGYRALTVARAASTMGVTYEYIFMVADGLQL